VLKIFILITTSRIESLLVGQVVEDITHKRIPTNLNISIYPLRYDTCHEYLSLFLQVGSKDVLIVGICGPRRMGKTAIAKAIYDQIRSTFEGSSFLTSVGQKSKQPDGLVYLQKKLLSDILLERNIAITNVTRGMDMIKEQLCFKRVLVVLDDVDDLDQLFYLVGKRSWFGLGSKIIITTRKVHLLNVLGVDQILLAQGLPLPQNIEASKHLSDEIYALSHVGNIYIYIYIYIYEKKLKTRDFTWFCLIKSNGLHYVLFLLMILQYRRLIFIGELI
jgi:hypothetical protein